MNATKRVMLVFSCVLAVALAFVTVRAASSSQEPDPQAPQALVGSSFTYQGQLDFDGIPINEECRMAFRLFDGAGALARQIGDTISLVVPISDGLFTVELDFGSSAFRGYARWLDIAVQCPDDRDPINLGRQELTAAPFALYALDAPWEGLPYAGVIVVAKSGGDYASVQTAIDSITDAAVDNAYLVWVAPGVYDEAVVMAPYVHLQGAGQGATVITRSDSSITLRLAAHTSLRDLTVVNDSAFFETYALLASSLDNVTGTLVANVQAHGLDSVGWSHGCGLFGSGTSVTLMDVTAHAEGGDLNYALKMEDGAAAILQGGSFTVSGGGTLNYAIYAHDAGTTLEASDTRAVAENTSGGSRGLYNSGTTTLRGGLYAAHGGHTVVGIDNEGSDATLVAESVTVEGLDGGSSSYGLYNHGDASATLHGGSFTARGGSNTARGLYVAGASSVLTANGISARATAANLNYGLAHNDGDSTITGSVLEGDYRSAYHGDGTLRLSHTSLLGTAGGSPTCLGVSTETNFYAESCP